MDKKAEILLSVEEYKEEELWEIRSPILIEKNEELFQTSRNIILAGQLPTL